MIPSSVRYPAEDVANWAGDLQSKSAVVACVHGGSRSEGVAAWLRQSGISAEVLEGGFEGWTNGGLPVVDSTVLPSRDAQGRTVWVTRARPKVDRIACPWLITRFIDAEPEFLYVPSDQVMAVAQNTGAVPYDVPGARFTHEGERCSFDAFMKAYDLTEPALQQLALIVRGADTAQLSLAPQSAGLLALSLGLSRVFSDDHDMLRHGLWLYDALYAWCRDGKGESHNWPPVWPTALAS